MAEICVHDDGPHLGPMQETLITLGILHPDGKVATVAAIARLPENVQLFRSWAEEKYQTTRKGIVHTLHEQSTFRYFAFWRSQGEAIDSNANGNLILTCPYNNCHLEQKGDNKCFGTMVIQKFKLLAGGNTGDMVDMTEDDLNALLIEQRKIEKVVPGSGYLSKCAIL